MILLRYPNVIPVAFTSTESRFVTLLYLYASDSITGIPIQELSSFFESVSLLRREGGGGKKEKEAPKPSSADRSTRSAGPSCAMRVPLYARQTLRGQAVHFGFGIIVVARDGTCYDECITFAALRDKRGFSTAVSWPRTRPGQVSWSVCHVPHAVWEPN
jgi:hypothetical protein